MNQPPAPEQPENTSSSPKFNREKLIDAFFIGFLIGIVIFSVVKSTWGLVTLLPLFLIYKLLKKDKPRDSR